MIATNKNFVENMFVIGERALGRGIVVVSNISSSFEFAATLYQLS